MLLSIVTGTYNRLALLRQMMNSVRSQMPRQIDYEFVVVDGGSTDGTLAWLADQPRARVVQHGDLRGAIRAFCDGAKAARGDYVVMANDDVKFWPNSLLRALAYLEEHRTCGAVAFADDRTARWVEHVHGHRVEAMPAVGANGQAIHVPYAQVGMFRRWLGDQIGWWGADDPIMGRARTYGGDNYLSAHIWQMGYSVDPVTGCAVDDIVEEDHLRALNRSTGSQDARQYYHRFPRGPQVKPWSTVPNPQRERLRAVVMDIHEPALPAAKAREYGLADAMGKQALTWHIDYVNEEYDIADVVRCWHPHVMLTQMHDTDRINADELRRARQQKPDMVIVNWNGDAHMKGLVSHDILTALDEVDLQTGVNAQAFPTYEELGIRYDYWQIGYKDPATPYPNPVPDYDLLFLGNAYNEARERLAALLNSYREQGLKVGLYGSLPEADGNTHYDFAHSRALYERCRIAISDTYDPEHTRGFVSNRLLQALSAGAFVLQQSSRDLKGYTGLTPGEHFVTWRDLKDLRAKIAEWTRADRAADRERIAARGKAYAREHFSYDAQVSKLWRLLPDDDRS